MNRRNILRGVAQPNLSAPPASLIYHAVLCYTFAVSLSIIHETQIPFTFFQDFLKKFSGPSQSRKARQLGLNLSVTGFAVTAPLVGEPLAYRRVFVSQRFATFEPAGVHFFLAAAVDFGAKGEKIKK